MLGNGNPLQYSCLGNPMDGEVWQTIVHGVTELDMSEQPHFFFFFTFYSFSILITTEMTAVHATHSVNVC